MIDTLKYTRELEGAGLNSEQAEKIVRAQIDMITTSVATRSDLKVLEARMDLEFTRVHSRFKEMDHKFEDVYRRFDDIDRRFDDVYSKLGLLDIKISALEDRLTYKLAGVMLLLLSLFEVAKRLI